MGNDKLFQRRKKGKLKRPKSKREPYDRVLIVCEGSKTEPNYLKELISHHRLSNAHIVVDGNCGSDPGSVVKHAELCYDRELKIAAYDRVYCVFDRDTHPEENFQGAKNKISTLSSRKRNAKPFGTIISIPCFEYWVLLHFEETAAPFEREGSKSPCDCVLAKVKEHVPGYAKGMGDLYACLKCNQEAAITRSRRILDAARQSGADNPTTHMHELVEYLIHLKDKK